jgi:hypothetical protein
MNYILPFRSFRNWNRGAFYSPVEICGIGSSLTNGGSGDGRRVGQENLADWHWQLCGSKFFCSNNNTSTGKGQKVCQIAKPKSLNSVGIIAQTDKNCH